MPNWCMNSLSVSGSANDVKRFCAQARGPTQTYNDFSPHTKEAWPFHEDIRLKSMVLTPPELGSVSELSFHALYPVPEGFRCFPYDDTRAKELGELVGQTRPYGGYQWESLHWGVKWGSCDAALVHKEDEFLQYEFNTAWGPPVDFFHKIAEDWPQLDFHLQYDEPGMGFRGENEWKAGSLVGEFVEEYNHDEDEDEDEDDE